MISPGHEPVHVFAEWCDGPRSGLADYLGRPHLYESLWRDALDVTCEDEWALVPVDAGAAAELLGRLRPSAHDAGAPTLYPGLSAESLAAFYAAWRAFVAAVLASEGEAVLAEPDMQLRAGWPHRDDDFDPLEVCWSVRGRTTVAAVRERFAELERIRAASQVPESGPSAGPEVLFLLARYR